MTRYSIRTLAQKKQKQEKLVMITCYDATFARLIDQTEVDLMLIGDSLGMVIQGHEHTIPVTLDEMIYHCKAVARGSKKAHLVGDLPFGTYQSGPQQALKSAMRLMKEGYVQSVKLEGGALVAESVRLLTTAGIPVMGHIGLTPQSVHQLGGYRIQGKSNDQAQRLLDDALLLQESGAFALVLEGMNADVATHISQHLTIPTIGIGAGAGCDGQVLVLYDLLGLDERFNPTFLKKYDQFSSRVHQAVSQYAQEVRSGAFPLAQHSHVNQSPSTPLSKPLPKPHTSHASLSFPLPNSDTSSHSTPPDLSQNSHQASSQSSQHC
jgi:3-methyl-2-oxobutanoate hydroxymethyltransferase